MSEVTYPDVEGYAYGFERGELSIGRKIVTAISGVQFSQPTTEGVVKGTRPWPLARTEGSMEIGTGTIIFTDESARIAFLTALGDGYRKVLWQLDWILTATGRDPVKFACFSCRVLDNGVDHSGGEEALAGELQFSFLRHTINGMSPHGET